MTENAQKTGGLAPEPKSTERRDHLMELEVKVQQRWDKARCYEMDAPPADAKEKPDKFLATFPYPYMNGVLHLGHAFTLSKAEFAVRYQRMKGKRALYPFGFHCTGMPIAACADKLKHEVQQYGNPPVFPPETVEEKSQEKVPVQEKQEAKEAPKTEAKADNAKGGKGGKDGKKGGDAKKDDKKGGAKPQEKEAEEEGEEEEEEDGEAPAAGGAAKAKSKPKKKGKEAKKKSKAKFQWQIMEEINVPKDEIAKFMDAHYWLSYFPPIAKTDLQRLGLAVDWRRSFITTDVNPYYDSFIRWQMNTLHRKGKLKFGKRASIFSPATQQPCADHDRASGETVNPQEYTLIKLKVVEPYPKAIQQLAEGKGKGKTFFLPAATLRPETMYGQTNCFVLPEGDYGAFVINDTDIFICSARSALNMSYQEMTPVRGEPECLGTIKGAELLGTAVAAPLATYPKVYVLPLTTISMGKGTGVVTSVPSDAPDDYAALMDLKKKPEWRKKFGITDEMVLPFEVVPIIEIPGFGTTAAATRCQELKVQSQKDKEKLEQIKDEVYEAGFYKGIMLVGEHKGQKVQDAKPLIKAKMIENKQALLYSEPESLVISRSGDECVVALTDQWYLVYGEPTWKAQVKDHIDKMNMFSAAAKKKYHEAVDWVREWACSRSYGLGTALPMDPQFLVESLSDSTIYMAYYSIAHLLQGGVLDGSTVGPAGIKPEQLTDDVWNYLFNHKEFPQYPAKCGIPQSTLDALRTEFEYWYPLDLRVSGKDLIANHLTMSVYNHAAMWEKDPNMWPRAFFTNGHIKVGGEKMSKSTGNFLTIRDCIERYGADATRFALADAGDGLQDANFGEDTANAIILRITKEEDWIDEVLAHQDNLKAGPPTTFLEKAFENDINRYVGEATEAMESMQYHEALRAGFYDLMDARNNYRASVDEGSMNKSLIMRYIEVYILMLSPICPHWCQSIWDKLGKKTLIVDERWPVAPPVDKSITLQMEYLRDVAHEFRTTVLKQTQLSDKKKGKPGKQKEAEPEKKVVLDSLYIFVAKDLPVWQQNIVDLMKGALAKSEQKQLPTPAELQKELTARKLVTSKKDTARAMGFIAALRNDFATKGERAFDLRMPFDELALVQNNLEFVLRGMAIPVNNTRVFANSDETAPNPSGRRAQAMPGKPSCHFFDSSAPPVADDDAE